MVVESFVEPVRAAAAAVGGLMRLSGADHTSSSGSSRDAERRVRWCRSVVMVLERAGEVLGQVRDGESGSGRDIPKWLL